MTIENWMGCCYDFSPLIIKNSFSKKNVSLKHLGTLLSKNIVEQFHYFLKFFYFKHFNSSCWKRMGDRYGFNPIIKNSSVKYKLNLRNDTPIGFDQTLWPLHSWFKCLLGALE